MLTPCFKPQVKSPVEETHMSSLSPVSETHMSSLGNFKQSYQIACNFCSFELISDFLESSIDFASVDGGIVHAAQNTVKFKCQRHNIGWQRLDS